MTPLLAARLRAARGSQTQAAWAAMAEVNQSTVARWEHGENSPDAEALGRLAAAAHLCLACLVLGPLHDRWRHAKTSNMPVPSSEQEP